MSDGRARVRVRQLDRWPAQSGRDGVVLEGRSGALWVLLDGDTRALWFSTDQLEAAAG